MHHSTKSSIGGVINALLRWSFGLGIVRAGTLDGLIERTKAWQAQAQAEAAALKAQAAAAALKAQAEAAALKAQAAAAALEAQLITQQRERDQLETLFQLERLELDSQFAALHDEIGQGVMNATELAGQVEQLHEELARGLTLAKNYGTKGQRLKATYEDIILRLRPGFAEGDGSSADNGYVGPATDAWKVKKRMVVVMTATSQITQLKVLAESEEVHDGYDLLVVAYADVAESGILEVCRKGGLQLFSHDFKVLHGRNVQMSQDQGGRPDLQNIESALAGEHSSDDISEMRDISKLVAEVRYQSDIAANVQRMLTRVAADLLVLFEDNAEYATGIWVNTAERMSIPSVILPYTIADELEPAEAYYLNQSYWPAEGIYNRLARIAFPHWLYHHRDRWLLRRNGVALIAAEALGVAPPAPWILNSSRASAIAVESEAMREHYLARGIGEAQLVGTGSLTDDLMYMASASAAKENLRRQLGLDKDRPVLLCSIPPNQLSVPRPQCPFPDFHSILDFWVTELGGIEGWQVVLKLHPSMRADDIDYIRTFDVRISDLDTTSLIPLCDLYNPSVSSTIRWALACGKPVLNYDVYGYNYRDFVSEPAVLTVSAAEDFSTALRRLTGDKETLRQLTEEARATAPNWGMLDGQSMQRIVALFDSFTERSVLSANVS
jgi:hypothetical protein